MSGPPYTRSAEVYDVIYGNEAHDYRALAQSVVSLIEERNPEAATLLEVACGTGKYVEHLEERFAVTGVDLSPAMLQIARARFPDLTFVEGDMRDFALGRRYDAVVCLFSSLGYMTTQDDLVRAVGTMAAHLTDGGVLIADGWLRPGVVVDGHVDVGSSTVGGVSVARMSFTRIVGAATEMDMHHLVGRTGHGVESYVERHVMGLFSDDEYLAAFSSAGLTGLAVVDGYPGRGRFVGSRPDALG